MVINYRKILVFSLFLIFLLSTTVAASSAKTIGLGNQFTTVTGSDALSSNPGAVNVRDNFFSLELGATASLWNNLLMNDYIDNADKEDLLENIEDDGLLFGTDVRSGGNLIVGPVGLVGDIKHDGLLRLNSDIAELLLQGNEIDREYEFDGSSGVGGVYGDVGLNLSLQAPQDLVDDWGIDDLYVGFTYHRLEGMIYQFEGQGSSKLTEDREFAGDGQFIVNYNDPDENLATGSAIDIGGYAILNDRYTIGFSTMNIGSLVVDGYTKAKYEYTDDEEWEEQDKIYKDEELVWQLPSTLRLGGKMDYTPNIDLLVDYAYTRYHESGYDDHKFSAATELTKLSFLPLRTGINYSTLQNDFQWAAGFGLHLGPLKADLGVSDLMGLFNESKGIEGGLTARIEF
ncbi:hypothetical protein MWH28_02680 [Natroniella sulfidigena]|uniref:hypothetical protein n=1 Tax=Natroniella sulfidigena TaxID=723921 RepID=UPI00200B2EA3|nr:hypothetical protein [Natroniella sulfidigena]MCK8816267.1 hypothetical protein [Natroniella sulfidigena]